MRDGKGQNLVEFGVIIAVLVIGGIAVYAMLGNNINQIFTGSEKSFSKYEPFDWKNDSGQTISVSGSAGLVQDPSPVKNSVNGTEVAYNENGSASFNVGNQQVDLSPDVMSKINTVFESSGASGGELDVSVMNAIQTLINAHAGEYPDGVPLNISFGSGKRSMGVAGNFNGGTYEGSASVNSTVVSVGDHKILVQKDQECALSDGSKNYGCGYVHTLEIKDGVGMVSSPFEFMNGVELKNISYDENGFPAEGSFYDEKAFDGGSWSFNFTGAEKTSL